MKSKFSVLFFLALTLTTLAQNKFNDTDYTVTNGDLATNTFDRDSTATALVIYEYGKTYVDKSTFDLTFEFKQKLKILNRNGLDKANITIRLYNSGGEKEKVKDIIATTYNLENGEIKTSKLDRNQIIEERYNANYTFMKLALPNVKEGTVITYSYKTTSPFMFKYQPWYFQDDIPKLYSEYNTSIPANYDYNIKLVGSQKLDINTSELKKYCLVTNSGKADCTESVYIMKNIPAFIDEDFMTTGDNYLSRIEYELKLFKSFDGGVRNYTKSWETVDKELKTEPGIGKQLNKKSVVKGLLSSEIESESDPLTKGKAILSYVQNNYIWNEKYNIFEDVSIKDLVKTKSGNATQINLLVYNLLKENEIEVMPIILSTRENGLPTKIYPVLSDFNYIIVQAIIDGKTYLLDATNKHLAFGQIPFRCLNQYGRLLDFKNGSKWVDIDAAHVSTKRYVTELEVQDDYAVKGDISVLSKGYPALSLKTSYYKNPKAYLKYYQDEYTDIEILDHEVQTKSVNSIKFEETFSVKLNTEIVGENTYVNPFLFVSFKESPFKLQDRTYPIDFGYKDAFQYSIKINLNGKYDVVELPKEIVESLPNKAGSLTFKADEENGIITLYLKYDFNEAIYRSGYYSFLKTFLNAIVNIENNTLIVLKKK